MYAEIITKATGITHEGRLREIEDVMRHDIFHSTLDWQTRAELEGAARQAKVILGHVDGQESDAAATPDEPVDVALFRCLAGGCPTNRSDFRVGLIDTYDDPNNPDLALCRACGEPVSEVGSATIPRFHFADLGLDPS